MDISTTDFVLLCILAALVLLALGAADKRWSRQRDHVNQADETDDAAETPPQAGNHMAYVGDRDVTDRLIREAMRENCGRRSANDDC